MRALGTLALGVVVSCAVSAVFQWVLGNLLDAPEERDASMAVEIVVALLVALVFAIQLAAGGGRRAIALAATAMIGLGVVSIAALAAFALTDQVAAIDPSNVPLMVEIGAPGVFTVVFQAWLIRAYLKRRGARAAAVPAEA